MTPADLRALSEKWRRQALIAVMVGREERLFEGGYNGALAECANELDAIRAQLAGEAGEDARDARLWRALIGCARIRPLGSAGIVTENADGYAHLGVELWTHHQEASTPHAIEWLTKFADKCAALSAQHQGERSE